MSQYYDYYAFLEKVQKVKIDFNDILACSYAKYCQTNDELKKVSKVLPNIKFEKIFDQNTLPFDKKKFEHLGLKLYEADITVDSYFSKDDKIYHPDYNLLSKEWVSGQPIIKSTSWKGLFRNAFYEIYGDKRKDLEEIIFGFTGDSGSRIGCLHFFTTILNNDKNAFTQHTLTKITKKVQPDKDQKSNSLKVTIKAQPIKYQTFSGYGIFRLLLSEYNLKSFNVEDVQQDIKRIIKKLEMLGIGAKRRINWGKVKFNNLRVNGVKC